MKELKTYIEQNSVRLFKYLDNNSLTTIFDKKGFYFDTEAQDKYNAIKDEPHLYVAWASCNEKFLYVGKSFQKGGRWKRAHAYHIGTLAHELLNTKKPFDQNHTNWISSWMDIKSFKTLAEENYSISFKNEVFICFIPFNKYSNLDFKNLEKHEIRKINTFYETELIKAFLADGYVLLNKQQNKNK